MNRELSIDHLHEGEPLLKALARRYKLLGAERRPSEEGEVWALKRAGEAPLWLKVHTSPHKAAREAQVYELIHGAQAIDFQSPSLLARPSGRSLLLSHLEGWAPLSAATLSDEARDWLIERLPRALQALHELRLGGPLDPVPLSQALALRWGRALQGFAQVARPEVLSPLRLPDGSLNVALSELHSLVELLERPSELSGLIGERGLCHRDLNAAHILKTPAAELGLLDFGQAREDWWGGDWATLWPHLSDRVLFSALLDDYLRRRGLADYREALRRCIRGATLAYTLNTLTWGARHRSAPVTQRGSRALREIVSAWGRPDAW